MPEVPRILVRRSHAKGGGTGFPGIGLRSRGILFLYLSAE